MADGWETSALQTARLDAPAVAAPVLLQRSKGTFSLWAERG